MSHCFDRLREHLAYATYDQDRFLERRSTCFDTSIPVLILGVTDSESVKKKIADFYGETIMTEDSGCILAEPKPLFEKTRFGYGDLLEIIRRLRDPDGCPWDRAQTPQSIRTNIIEEAYELIEALDMDDDDKILEECGDVLLQGVFVSVMTEEQGRVSNSDVITALCKKLIGRHTHIFGKDKATDAESALGFWEKAKAKEKGYTSVEDKLNAVPKTFTALQKANKVQKIVKKTGFDFPDVQGAIDKLEEEIEEFTLADGIEKEKEGGDILFSAVNVLRKCGIDPEVALFGTTDRFEKRFRYVIDRAKEEGKEVEELTLDEMEVYYNESKKFYK